jgi:hypothetical protein
MSDLTCTRVRRSKFIDRDVVFDITIDDPLGYGGERRIETSLKLRKEFNKLGMAFHRNRVELRFTLERTPKNDQSSWVALKEQVKEFCDSRLEGYWTWKLRRYNDRDTDGYKLEMDLMFEHEADMKLWLKDHGMIIRLTL